MRSYSRNYGYRFDLSGYFPPAIKALCIACTSVFVVQELSRFIFGAAGWNFWLVWFGLVPYYVTHGYLWQIFTYLFLHGGVLHLALNLLFLCMFGADLERAWGARRFLFYYFLCGVGAGLVNVLVKTAMDPHGHGSALAPTIGASGAIYGIMLAAAIVMPHSQVWVFPLPVTVSMRVFIIAMIAIEFLGTIGSAGDNVSHVCHLGGIAVGYLYLRRGSFLYSARNYISDRKRKRLRHKFDVYVRDHEDKPPNRPDNWVN